MRGIKFITNLIDLLALVWSTDSVATPLSAFWYKQTGFLLIRLPFQGLKMISGGLKSLGMNASGPNKSMESDMKNVLKYNQ